MEVDRHYYSIPYQYHGRRIDVRITRNLIEGDHKGTRITAHRRLYGRQRPSAREEHMHANHQWVAGLSPERFLQWGTEIGSSTRAILERILLKRAPVQPGATASHGTWKAGFAIFPHFPRARATTHLFIIELLILKKTTKQQSPFSAQPDEAGMPCSLDQTGHPR